MSTCIFSMAWRGACRQPAFGDPPICDRHKELKCWCGAQAVKECDAAVSLVCGAPTCSEHECKSLGGSFTGGIHSHKGRQQWEEWKRKKESEG